MIKPFNAPERRDRLRGMEWARFVDNLMITTGVIQNFARAPKSWTKIALINRQSDGEYMIDEKEILTIVHNLFHTCG